jgi:MFS superfamily sulfate permease-like transporter
VGYKLADPRILKGIYRADAQQWIPTTITTVAILFSDLLVGISIGIVVGLFFVVKANFHSPFTITQKDKEVKVVFNRDVSFLNKAALVTSLEKIANWSNVVIDGDKARFIDHDIAELLREFEIAAKLKNITVTFENISSEESSRKRVEYFHEDD